MHDEQPVQLSLDQVESLILSLYQANSPEVIAKAQSTLAVFQGSPQAWPMIHRLLDRPDDKVKFFGALTVIIKLNRESSSLCDDDASELLVRLVEWYSLSLVRGRSGSLVSRKLSSAIATFFLHFHLDDSVNTGDILPRLDSPQLQAVIWVVTSVMEDAARFDLNAATNAGLYDAIVESTTDAVALMAMCLSSHVGDSAAHGDSVKCLQVSPLAPHVSFFVAVISSLSDNSLFDASAELIVDVLSNHPSLMTEAHYEYLANLFAAPWAQERYERLLQGDFEFDSVQFGHLLLGFGEAKAEALIQSSDGRTQHLLSLLCGLLGAAGYPVAEDRIYVPAVEFWSTFAETMADFVHLDGAETSTPWAASAMSQLLKAVSRAWQKITYPPSEEYNQWDSVDRIGFNDARKDVVDFLQSAYTLVGTRLVVTFADLTLSALSSSAWLPLESAAFCLGGLADCGRDDARFDEALTPVFASPLFSVLRANGHDAVHPRARQTCLSLIEQYNEYFERNAEFQAPALRLLFTLLAGFLDEYANLADGRRLDCISTEKVLGAIACVAQAIPDANQRQIMGILQDLEGAFGTNSEVIELISGALRSGFSESEPGPFVFPPDMVTRFLISHAAPTMRVGVFVSTACSFVSSLQSHEAPNRESIFSTLLLWDTELLRQLSVPEDDPELSQNGIEFASRLLSKSPATILALQPADATEFLFLFTLRVLDGKEPLPKGASADFWSIYVSLGGDEQLQHAIGVSMEALGPLLALSLARNIGGNASRSELDKLSEPLKKLVSRHPAARDWLQTALGDASFPSGKVSPDQKAMFVKKVIRYVRAMHSLLPRKPNLAFKMGMLTREAPA
ncbi:Armadillo-type fold protein [Purpureocillium lavendulum]|uniref:Armadillo-type fold protein n=1 Tax=Purpureocillium lavendulum TaxID=1247861 RepID=A0AB34FLB6_9HYPO|nr:Armadillo-type fold protein [Purpureocillium lavendulum]